MLSWLSSPLTLVVPCCLLVICQPRPLTPDVGQDAHMFCALNSPTQASMRNVLSPTKLTARRGFERSAWSIINGTQMAKRNATGSLAP